MLRAAPSRLIHGGIRRLGCHISSALPKEAQSVIYNEANIQMLSEQLHATLFPSRGHLAFKRPAKSRPVAKDDMRELVMKHLEIHDIPVNERRPALPDVPINLPPLLGGNIQEHFWRLGDIMSRPYYAFAANFGVEMSNFQMESAELMGGRWQTRPGWSKYSFAGDDLGAVRYPAEDTIVLDVETCPNHGPWPLMAVALSSQALYAWVSPHLFGDDQGKSKAPRLIPMKMEEPSLVIGHNVSYDRARILGEYTLKKGKMAFVDTLSMHVAVAGLSSQQRGTWMNFKKECMEGSSSPIFHDTPSELNEGPTPAWMECSSMNNLADAVALHCDRRLDKSPRDILVKGTIEDVRREFQRLMTYCANDVLATCNLYVRLFHKFLDKNPHPVTFSAMLEMGSCFLPVNESWPAYTEKVEGMYRTALARIDVRLRELAKSSAKEGQIDEAWKRDPWWNKLDWKAVPARYTKPRYKSDGSYATKGEPRPIGNVALFGKPAWYKKIYDTSTGEPDLTPKSRILPYLLKMKWEGHPVHYIAGHGWCYGMAQAHPTPRDSAGGELALIVDPAFPEFKYFKIPHLDDQRLNSGSLMTKKHMKCLEKGILSTDSPIVKDVLLVNGLYSFWTGYRERIREQMVIWDSEPGVALGFESGSKSGMILPQLLTMGTVTRRAVEPTWMTATNSKKNLVGSELKSMIRAPKGYVFIGADVDSQELWISSLLGDSQFGFPGASALGWMTLQGAKADNTDLHSRTASILGMSRDDAKIFNYGRIYGAGMKYAAQLLQKFNPSISPEEATKKARELYSKTKGKKAGLSGQKVYFGGTESFMFNVLEEIAQSHSSTTPTLGSVISDALLCDNVADEYLTSRVNWVVQSSGVDYLHMLIASMSYLMRKYGIKGRLSLTIHDEVRYLVAEEDQFRAALALQIANCWTRAMFAYSAGMDDLPLSVAFFSAVDFDHVLRKEAFTDCVTPSNSTPVPPGFALDIYKLLARVPEGLGSAVDSELLRLESTPCVRTFCRQAQRRTKDLEYIRFQIEGPRQKAEKTSTVADSGSRPANHAEQRRSVAFGQVRVRPHYTHKTGDSTYAQQSNVMTGSASREFKERAKSIFHTIPLLCN